MWGRAACLPAGRYILLQDNDLRLPLLWLLFPPAAHVGLVIRRRQMGQGEQGCGWVDDLHRTSPEG